MPLSRVTTRIVREGATMTVTAQWRRDPDTGALTPQVNGVFSCATTKADGSGAQMMTTGVDGIPAIVDVLTAAEKAQLAALADRVFAALRDTYGLTEA